MLSTHCVKLTLFWCQNNWYHCDTENSHCDTENSHCDTKLGATATLSATTTPYGIYLSLLILYKAMHICKYSFIMSQICTYKYNTQILHNINCQVISKFIILFQAIYVLVGCFIQYKTALAIC